MTRILLVPNYSITYSGGSIEQDSYFSFLEKFLVLMKENRNEVFWYVLVPKLSSKESIVYSNIKKKLGPKNSLFIELDLLIYPQNQIHFNIKDLSKKLKWRDYPIDLIFCHQLDTSNQVKLFFKNETNLDPPIIGYYHLLELPKLDWKGIFEYNILGITEMVGCFVNTNFQKQLIIEEARKIFSSSICGVLKDKLEVLPKLVVPNDIKPSKYGNYKKIIYWGDRSGYTKSFINFQFCMRELRKKRQDFKVWVPNLKKGHQFFKKSWVTNGFNNNNRTFFKYLRTCCVGVSPRYQINDWVGTITQGIKSGVPFIVHDSSMARSLFEKSTFYKSNKDLINHLNKFLDNIEFRNLAIGNCIGDLIHKHNQLKKMKVMDLSFKKALKSVKSINNSKTKEIIKLIKKHKSISHKDLLSPQYLSWDSNINFLGYRKAILGTGKIEEVNFETKRKNSKSQKFPWKAKYRFK